MTDSLPGLPPAGVAEVVAAANRGPVTNAGTVAVPGRAGPAEAPRQADSGSSFSDILQLVTSDLSGTLETAAAAAGPLGAGDVAFAVYSGWLGPVQALPPGIAATAPVSVDGSALPMSGNPLPGDAIVATIEINGFADRRIEALTSSSVPTLPSANGAVTLEAPVDSASQVSADGMATTPPIAPATVPASEVATRANGSGGDVDFQRLQATLLAAANGRGNRAATDDSSAKGRGDRHAALPLSLFTAPDTPVDETIGLRIDAGSALGASGTAVNGIGTNSAMASFATVGWQVRTQASDQATGFDMSTATSASLAGTARLPTSDTRLALQPLGDAGLWSQNLGDRMVTMAQQGAHTARLKLYPEHLGPLDVELRIDDGTAQVWFHSHHPQTREALETALPRLREMFADQGLNLAQAHVGSGDGQRFGRDSATPLPEPVAVRAFANTAPTAGQPRHDLARVAPGRVDVWA